MEFVLADPVGSILAEYVKSGKIGEAGSWAVEGIGEDFIPPIADLSGVKHAYSISDEESFATARELLRAEGISGGSSTGTLLAAALRFCREQKTAKRVVSFVCDTGTRYLSKVYNDQWMIDQGLLKRPQLGDLRDLIARRFDEGAVVAVGPDDTLMTAFQRMRLADVSQLPVLDKKQLLGVIDESDLLLTVHDDAARFHSPVSGAMTKKLDTVRPDASLDALRAILDRGLVAIIADDKQFYGLVTRFDLLNHLAQETDMKTKAERARLCYARDSRRSVAGSVDWRDHAADLRDVDVRATESGCAQGTRLRPLAQPDALGARALRGGPGERRSSVCVRIGHGGDRDRARNCLTPARMSWPATICTAARFDCSSACASAAPGMHSRSSTCRISTS